MIGELPELMRWSRAPMPSGEVILTAPHDPSATVRIQLGCRPLCSLRALVGDATPLGPIRRIITETGEYAAMIPLRVERGGAPSTRVVGVVVGDADYTLIEGTAHDPAIGVVVELLLRSRVQLSSPARARMVPYRVPAGWLGLRRPLATCWLAPRYPRDRSRLVVLDAIPLASAVGVTQELLWPLAVPLGARVEEINRVPFRGQLASGEREGAIFAIAEIADRAFHYRIQLHDGTSGALACMRELVASLEPITQPILTAAGAPRETFDWCT